jgi:dolichol-phosphate mannosyltransferase
MSILVCIPTYNEKENIAGIIAAVLAQGNDIEILIIDDNSPDGTAAMVETMMPDNKRIHLLKRPGKLGLGTAYLDGFKYGLTLPHIKYFMQMDADFSHDPKELANFLQYIEEYDLVIGSRYISGVNVVNWPISRLLLSYFANLYTRIITGLHIYDCTGGFKCFRRKVLESIDLDQIHSNGYSFQIEMNFKTWKKGFKIFEFPIVFVDRFQGSSKMSKKIVREAIFMVWKLRWKSMFGTLK